MRSFKIRPSRLILLSFLFSFSVASDILTPDHPLSTGKTLVSANGTFAIGFFSPSLKSNNFYVGIWYNKISVHTVVCVANRNSPALETNASLSITVDGTLLIADGNSSVVWSSVSEVSTVNNPLAQLLENGNFVIRDANTCSTSSERYPWQSFDYPTTTLLPGMKLGWNLTSGVNRNLTAWNNLTDPSTGQHAMSLDTSGDPQIFLRSGQTTTGQSGPWNGIRFSGRPEMQTYIMFKFEFVWNADEIYFQFHVKDPTVISWLIVNQAGIAQRLVWLDETQTWNVFWFTLKDQCDSVSACGPFGLCNQNESPVCECVRGFLPRDPANWALRDGSNGCIRKTGLDCRNGTDGFVTINEVKLPDTSRSSVDVGSSSDQCRAKCLGSCSCTAYASADINGTGCLIWTSNLTDLRVWTFGGQDLYVRLAASDSDISATHLERRQWRSMTASINFPQG